MRVCHVFAIRDKTSWTSSSQRRWRRSPTSVTAASLAVGGFGLRGIPETLIDTLYEEGATDISVVSNNCRIDDVGLGVLTNARFR
jgi:hypothetical protein